MAQNTPFESERIRFGLHCFCDECIHFDAEKPVRRPSGQASMGSCTLGYPTLQHRPAALEDGSFVFCKSFEVT